MGPAANSPLPFWLSPSQIYHKNALAASGLGKQLRELPFDAQRRQVPSASRAFSAATDPCLILEMFGSSRQKPFLILKQIARRLDGGNYSATTETHSPRWRAAPLAATTSGLLSCAPCCANMMRSASLSTNSGTKTAGILTGRRRAILTSM